MPWWWCDHRVSTPGEPTVHPALEYLHLVRRPLHPPQRSFRPLRITPQRTPLHTFRSPVVESFLAAFTHPEVSYAGSDRLASTRDRETSSEIFINPKVRHCLFDYLHSSTRSIYIVHRSIESQNHVARRNALDRC
jgi:hypothetical protein